MTVLCEYWIVLCLTDFVASFTCDICITFQDGKANSKTLQEFWGITLCSPVKVNWTLPCTALLFAWFMMVSCLIYSSNLKMEATCSSVTSVDFHRTTWHYIPEDRTLDNHCWANLKSYNLCTRKIEEFNAKKDVAQSVFTCPGTILKITNSYWHLWYSFIYWWYKSLYWFYLYSNMSCCRPVWFAKSNVRKDNWRVWS
jgi:hypothetical protein